MFSFVCKICERKTDLSKITTLTVEDLSTSHYSILDRVCEECNRCYREKRARAIEEIKTIDEQIKTLNEKKWKIERSILENVKRSSLSGWKRLMDYVFP